MPAKLTQAQFVERATAIHDGKYDYSKSVYENSTAKIIVICPTHGEFEQQTKDHLKGSGCWKCKGSFPLDQNTFISRANQVHGEKYIYDNAIYAGMFKKLVVTCPEHGNFNPTPSNHLNGSGCPACAGLLPHTNESFIEKAKQVHGDRYDYSLVEYVNFRTDIIVICKVHGNYIVRPNNHISRVSGCPICKCMEASERLRSSTMEFVINAKRVHGDRYDYSLVEYITNTRKVKIICQKHGIFEQSPNGHVDGKQDCPICAKGNVSAISQEWLTHHGVALDQREILLRFKDRKLKVDGYDRSTNTIYEFWGDYYHGNPNRFDLDNTNKVVGKTFRELYEKTLERRAFILANGYNLVEVWESEWEAERTKYQTEGV